LKEEAADARLVALAFRRDTSRKPTGGQVDTISDKRDRREKVVSEIPETRKVDIRPSLHSATQP